ncbi:MAG: type II secretion system protein [Rhizobiaceae bacterium]
MSADATDIREAGEAGFTLLETIIAFLILSLSLAIAVETISRGGLSFRRAGDLEYASFMMEQLAAGEVRSLAIAGVTSGSIGDGEWEITARAVEDNFVGDVLLVNVEVRPRGDEGPVFDYVTTAVPGREE